MNGEKNDAHGKVSWEEISAFSKSITERAGILAKKMSQK